MSSYCLAAPTTDLAPAPPEKLGRYMACGSAAECLQCSARNLFRLPFDTPARQNIFLETATYDSLPLSLSLHGAWIRPQKLYVVRDHIDRDVV